MTLDPTPRQTPPDDQGRDRLHHRSGSVWCAPRGAGALVSVVERDGPRGRLCTVVWCSLRGGAQWCEEACARSSRPPLVDGE